MRRWLVVFLLALGAAATAAVAYAAAAPAGGDRGGGLGGRHAVGRGYFAVVCGFSHRNQDDPIVFFNQPGRSHDHVLRQRGDEGELDPAALRASGETTCRLRAATAAYWAPTLFVAGRAVRPLGAIVYYIRRTLEPVQAFPANLKVVAGSAAARSAQGSRITYWSCGRRGVLVSELGVAARPACGSSSSSRTAGTAVGSTAPTTTVTSRTRPTASARRRIRRKCQRWRWRCTTASPAARPLSSPPAATSRATRTSSTRGTSRRSSGSSTATSQPLTRAPLAPREDSPRGLPGTVLIAN